jgi:hypothetical protein
VGGTMTNQGFTGSGRGNGGRRFIRVRWTAGECEHRAMVGTGDHAGRCLECGTCVPTPFTIHRSERRPTGVTANRLAMDEVQLPAPVAPVMERCAA